MTARSETACAPRHVLVPHHGLLPGDVDSQNEAMSARESDHRRTALVHELILDGIVMNATEKRMLVIRFDWTLEITIEYKPFGKHYAHVQLVIEYVVTFLTKVSLEAFLGLK
ncbi:MAG: hypothetical protein GY740_08965 [Gammaproteobacteria bacterium]|nr:hypothetical protein [Gammaproteobacteria bacterium]